MFPQTHVEAITPENINKGESPGKNTGVGCHALLQGIFLTQGWNPHLLCLLNWQAGSFGKSLQSCPTLCDPIDSSSPGSPVHPWNPPGKKAKSESEVPQSLASPWAAAFTSLI